MDAKSAGLLSCFSFPSNLQPLDEWKLIFDAAPEVGPEATAEREKRRKHMADIVIAVDPDRQMIVQVYGEETTSAIESAVMY